MKKQFGFTALEGLLILIAVGIVGFAGWYVYEANNKTQDSYANADQSNSSTAQIKDPTADWVLYTSKDGKYSIKYPKSWVKVDQVVPCVTSDESLLLGVNSESTGHYCADGPGSSGQISVGSQPGDSCKDSDSIFKNGFKDQTAVDVTVDKVSGVKKTATATGQENAEAIAYPLSDGTMQVIYFFCTNNRTYTANYYSKNFTTVYPDALNDFNTMVTKTLKFTAS